MNFPRLFGYDAWANRESIAALPETPSPRALAILGHLAGSQRNWLSRLAGRTSSLVVWPTLTRDQCAAELATDASAWSAYLATGPDLGAKLRYTNVKGESLENSIEEVLTHVLMHSAYHRGQLAMLTRDTGDTPATTDFIFASRKGLV
ncbi:MAG TPA: DinB family protein [Gemmatimonadaceae bacterium]|jgi:uncharacterized damage-inducible protein DinB|nr:DinB family protein [Gemmatimonadaceae bacterium]